MPRYDQSFTGLCEQGLQDTLHLKQRYLDAKSKRVSKAKEKKQDNTASGAGIQSSVHVQQKFLKRSVDDLDSSGADNFGEPPVKLQCNNEGLTKFSVEIVQQLEFTTSAANSQPQQISTNVTVKTHANTSVKSDVSSPKSNPATPQNQQQSQQHQQKSNIGLDIGLDVKQEPDNDFADLDSCAAALEKDAAANGGAGFGASFPDLMGEDDNGDMSDAFKDLISDISNYHDYPELMKELDFEDKSDLGVLKMEDSKDHAHIPLNPDLKHPQNHMLGNQNNFSNPMFEKNGMSGRMPYSSVPNMDFTKTELSPAAQTLKQMAEQHQHKNQMGLNFNPANRAPNVRSPYQDFQNFQGEYNSPNSNPNFKNNPNFPSPDMIKQEMIYQGDFNEVKRKAQSAGGMYPNKQQYSPYGSPGSGPGGHVSPGFLPNRGAAGQPTPNSGQFGGAGTPPRPPSGSGGGPQGQGGTTLQINQAQHLNITQQSQGHNIQVSAGQHVHLSGDLKGNVSIATQQGMHFTHQQHQSNPNGGQSQNKNNQQSSQGGNNQSNSGSQANHMAGNNQGPMNQQSSQQMNPNLNQMHQQMPNQQSNMSNMSNPNSSIPNMGNNQSMGPNSAMGGNPTMGGNGNPGNGGMPGALGSMMGGPNMPHGAMGHGDSYSMSQTQTINFTQQNLRRATGMGNSMGGPNTMGPGGPMAGPTGSMGPRLISAQTMEQQKLMQQQHMLRAQQAAMQQQQLRPPPPDYKASAGLGQGGMQPRFGTPAPPPNMRRMPHQPIPPSGPMIRSNMQYMLQQQQQQMPVRQAIFRGQQTPMGMEMQQNSAEWRHMMMSQQQNVSFGGMRPGFQQGGFNMNASGNPMQHQMSALQHQQQLRSQQAMGNNQGGLGQLMTHNGGPMAQMNSMNQAMLHMQQQQNMMQQQNSQMSMSSLHMQQSQSLSVNNMQNSMSSQNSGALLNESINSVVSSGASGQTNNTLNPGNNPLSGFNPGTDFNFEFLDNLPGTNDTTPFTDQELLNSFDADSGFTLDF